MKYRSNNYKGGVLLFTYQCNICWLLLFSGQSVASVKVLSMWTWPLSPMRCPCSGFYGTSSAAEDKNESLPQLMADRCVFCCLNSVLILCHWVQFTYCFLNPYFLVSGHLNYSGDVLWHHLIPCYLLRRKASLNSLGRLWVGRVLFYLFAFGLETILSALMTFEQRGTPTLTGALSIGGLILRTAAISCHLGQTRGTQNLSLLGSPLGQWAEFFYHVMFTLT